jgi:hypothetical protein
MIRLARLLGYLERVDAAAETDIQHSIGAEKIETKQNISLADKLLE